MIVDVANAQVIFDVVQAVSKRVALGLRLGNCLGDAPDDRSDDEDAKQVVDSHEDTLQLRDWVKLRLHAPTG